MSLISSVWISWNIASCHCSSWTMAVVTKSCNLMEGVGRIREGKPGRSHKNETRVNPYKRMTPNRMCLHMVTPTMGSLHYGWWQIDDWCQISWLYFFIIHLLILYWEVENISKINLDLIFKNYFNTNFFIRNIRDQNVIIIWYINYKKKKKQYISYHYNKKKVI